MANTHETLTGLFSDIADAIRGKTDSAAQIVADAFPDAIAAIPQSGSGDTMQTRYLTLKKMTVTIGANTVANAEDAHLYFSELVPQGAFYKSIAFAGTPPSNRYTLLEVLVTNSIYLLAYPSWAGNTYYRVNEQGEVGTGRWSDKNYTVTLYEGDQYDIIYLERSERPA